MILSEITTQFILKYEHFTCILTINASQSMLLCVANVVPHDWTKPFYLERSRSQQVSVLCCRTRVLVARTRLGRCRVLIAFSANLGLVTKFGYLCNKSGKNSSSQGFSCLLMMTPRHHYKSLVYFVSNSFPLKEKWAKHPMEKKTPI